MGECAVTRALTNIVCKPVHTSPTAELGFLPAFMASGTKAGYDTGAPNPDTVPKQTGRVLPWTLLADSGRWRARMEHGTQESRYVIDWSESVFLLQ